jgi:pimeloyl-ACP methyl ester carboxylesterase
MNRRQALCTIGMAGVASSLPAHAIERQTERTYVLVHGAWHGAWCWGEVASRLRAVGNQVFAVTHTGLGDRAHLLSPSVGLATFVEDVVALIGMEDLHEVILVGHSFAGSIISGVADILPDKIRHLVYLDALVLQSGQSPFSMFSPDIVAARRKAAIKVTSGLCGDTLALPPPSPSAFGITDPNVSAWLASRMRPHPIQTYEDKLELKNPVGNGRPCTYIACTEPAYAALKPTHQWAKNQSDWSYREIATGHDAMVLAPDALTNLLLTQV